ncbi:hypothetical protein [Streptomyces sp. TE3672]
MQLFGPARLAGGRPQPSFLGPLRGALGDALGEGRQPATERDTP